MTPRPTLLRRSRTLRWIARAVLLLAACEGSLALAARVYSRRLLGGDVAGAVVCVGDSNTFGLGAPEGSSYPDRLRELLARSGLRTPVVNLGFPGLRAEAAVARLEDALEDGTPSCVVFLAGENDWTCRESLITLDAPAAAPRDSARRGLRRLRTVRALETMWRVLRGDVLRPEFGGSEPPPVLALERPAIADPQAEYARDRQGGARGIVPWLARAWALEEPQLAQQAFDDLLAVRGAAQLQSEFDLPIDCYRFELALLTGGTAPLPKAPPTTADAAGLALLYCRFAAGYAELAAGRADAAREQLQPLAGEAKRSWRGCYLRTHSAWAALLARDWPRAQAELDAVLADVELLKVAALTPRPAERHLQAGAALARLFADTTFLLDQLAPARRDRFVELAREREGFADGRAWLLAVEWLDALKRAATADAQACAGRARALLVEALAPTPLHWLVEHPQADFATARDRIELSPPRAAWLGVKPALFREINDDELAKLTAPAHARLAALAREHGFPVVVVTYLDFNKRAPSDGLRALARAQGWPLVDLQAVYAEEELAADDKLRHFSADRSHPNASGYELMATALLPVVRELLARR